ncbi:hypothetical protein L208DRAFT_1022027, partial [Tricholoma matsutake]
KCLDCEQGIQVGTAGSKNLEIHRAERERKAQAWRKPKEKWNGLLHAFFRPTAAVNPSTVSAPLRIHAPEVPSAASLTEDHAEPQSLPSTTLHAAPDTPPEGLEGDNVCPMAVKLLCELQAGVERIPADKPKAIPSHRLSAFSVDPSSCIGQGDDDWEDILNPMMKGAFGWG